MPRSVGGPMIVFISGRFATIFGASGLLMSTIATESLPGGRRTCLPLSKVILSSRPMIMSWAWATMGARTSDRASASVFAVRMRNSPLVCGLGLRTDDPVGEHADLLAFRFHAVPGLEEVAGRRAHAVRRAGGDDVTGQERHGERQHLDALVHGKDHLAGVARLAHLAAAPHGDA